MARTVAARGYRATSVADVLQEARVSRRTFYAMFSGKEECFLAAYDLFDRRCQERVGEACRGTAAWEERLERALDALLGLLAAEPAFARLAVVEVLAAGSRGLDRRDRTLRRFADRLEYRPSADEPPAMPPPDLTAAAVVGGIAQLIYAQIVRGEIDRLTTLTRPLVHYTAMLLGSADRPW